MNKLGFTTGPPKPWSEPWTLTQTLQGVGSTTGVIKTMTFLSAPFKEKLSLASLQMGTL